MTSASAMARAPATVMSPGSPGPAPTIQTCPVSPVIASSVPPVPGIRRSAELGEDEVDVRLCAGEHRRVAKCVEAGLGVAQPAHQVNELLRVVRIEGHDELLIVDPI